MFIQNRMQRAFYFPAWIVDGVEKVAQVLIGPGESSNAVSKEHFDGVRKDNPALKALLDERHLIASEKELDDSVKLSNPTIEAPADLSDDPEGVTRKAKVENVEVDVTPEVKSDEPAETKRTSRAK